MGLLMFPIKVGLRHCPNSTAWSRADSELWLRLPSDGHLLGSLLQHSLRSRWVSRSLKVSAPLLISVTGDGGVRVFDLQINRYKQICKQVLLTTRITQFKTGYKFPEDHHVPWRRPQQDRIQQLGARDSGGRHHGDNTQSQTVTKPPQEDQGDHQGSSEQQSQGNTVSPIISRRHHHFTILSEAEIKKLEKILSQIIYKIAIWCWS